jgi:hypothetical protein
VRGWELGLASLGNYVASLALRRGKQARGIPKIVRYSPINPEIENAGIWEVGIGFLSEGSGKEGF